MHLTWQPGDPVIQLNFPNPLNVSVQVGDVAYFSNPTAVGQPQEWTATTTPHLANPQGGIMMIGEIIQIIPWNGTVSSIICNMPQALFNQYFDQIIAGGCVYSLNNSSNCSSKTLVPYSELLANSSGFTDVIFQNPGMPYNFILAGPGQGTPIGYGGPQIYSYQIGLFPTISGDGPYPGHSGEFGTMILHWFWDHANGQNLIFSDYAFEHWSGDIWYLDQFDFSLVPGVHNYFNNVTEIIDFWQDQLATYESTTYSVPSPNPLGSPSWYTQSPYYNMSTVDIYNSALPAVNNYNRPANHIAIVHGCSFDAYYNRLPREVNRLTKPYAMGSEDVHQCTGVTTDCTQGSFIMFSKDNKVNMSDMLGYYASVELRNNSTTEAELFNVGTTFFESSK